jgi:hypothetical protein
LDFWILGFLDLDGKKGGRCIFLVHVDAIYCLKPVFRVLIEVVYCGDVELKFQLSIECLQPRVRRRDCGG